MHTDDTPQAPPSLDETIEQLKQLRGIKFKELHMVTVVAVLYGFIVVSYGFDTAMPYFGSLVVCLMALNLHKIKETKRTDVIHQSTQSTQGC